MSRINLHSLQILASIKTSKSFSKTAQELNMTPSAVSKRVAELETRFSTPLVIRSRHAGVELTPAGEAVVRCSEDVMRRVSAMSVEVAALLLREKGEVRVVANTTAILLGLLEDINQFRQAHQGIRITVREHPTREVAAAVRNHRADIGICVDSDVVRGLVSFAYRRTSLVVAMPPTHPLASMAFVTPEALAHYPVLWQPPTERAYGLRSQEAAQASVELSVHSFGAVLRSVADGAGIAVVPQITMNRFALGGVIALELEAESTPFQLVVCHDPTLHCSPHVQQLFSWLCSRASTTE